MQQSTLLLVLGFALLMSACAHEPEEKTMPTALHPTKERAKPSAYKRKFRSMTTSADGLVTDTMLIDFHFQGDSLSGRMHWLPGQKDKMKGTLSGHLRGDTVVAAYTYSAEGVQRTEPRFFLLGPDRVTLLSGDLIETNEALHAAVLPKLKLGLVVPEVR